MSDVTVAIMEAHIQELQKEVELKDLYLKLENNREFQTLVLDGFCKNECARNAQNSVNPMFSAETRTQTLGAAQAAGHLLQYFSNIVVTGTNAENQIKRAKEDIEEMRYEGEEG